MINIGFLLLALSPALLLAEVQISEFQSGDDDNGNLVVSKCIGLDTVQCARYLDEKAEEQFNQLDEETKEKLSELAQAAETAFIRSKEIELPLNEIDLMTEAATSLIDGNSGSFEEIEQTIDEFCSKLSSAFSVLSSDYKVLISRSAAETGSQGEILNHKTKQAVQATKFCNLFQQNQIAPEDIRENWIREKLHPKMWNQLAQQHAKVFSKIQSPGYDSTIELSLKKLYEAHTAHLNELARLSEAQVIHPSYCNPASLDSRRRAIWFYGDYPNLREYLRRFYDIQLEQCRMIQNRS